MSVILTLVWPQGAGIQGQGVPIESQSPLPPQISAPALMEEERFLLKSRAIEMSESGLHQEAVLAYGQYFSKDFSDIPAAIEYSLLLAHLKRHEEAVKVLEKIRKLAPEHEVVAYRLGCEYVILKKFDEAQRLFRELEGSANDDMAIMARVAQEAAERDGQLEARVRAGKRVYSLVHGRRDEEILKTLQMLQKEGVFSRALGMEGVYALQRLGRVEEALTEMRRLMALPADPLEKEEDLSLLKADLLVREKRYAEAIALLKKVEKEHPGERIASSARLARLALPAQWDLDRDAWGEMFADATYTGRLGTVIGSGYLREGTFVPGARWIQPYAEFGFVVDTRSDGNGGPEGLGSVFSENLAALNLGLRFEPLPLEGLDLYVSGGAKKDLIGTQRYAGDWFADMQAGIAGYHGFGPGTEMRDVLETVPDDWEARMEREATGGRVTGLVDQEISGGGDFMMPRGDWFVEGGGDFSYYRRLADWIGYGQAREGVRLLQFGREMAVDAYALQNITWDSRGSFFDNYTEVGPGARILWIPAPVGETAFFDVTLRMEYANGWYWGRDDLGRRGGSNGSYDDFRVNLSVSSRW